MSVWVHRHHHVPRRVSRERTPPSKRCCVSPPATSPAWPTTCMHAYSGRRRRPRGPRRGRPSAPQQRRALRPCWRRHRPYHAGRGDKGAPAGRPAGVHRLLRQSAGAAVRQPRAPADRRAPAAAPGAGGGALESAHDPRPPCRRWCAAPTWCGNLNAGAPLAAATTQADESRPGSTAVPTPATPVCVAIAVRPATSTGTCQWPSRDRRWPARRRRGRCTSCERPGCRRDHTDWRRSGLCRTGPSQPSPQFVPACELTSYTPPLREAHEQGRAYSVGGRSRRGMGMQHCCRHKRRVQCLLQGTRQPERAPQGESKPQPARAATLGPLWSAR
jgi:hypothetical protein